MPVPFMNLDHEFRSSKSVATHGTAPIKKDRKILVLTTSITFP